MDVHDDRNYYFLCKGQLISKGLFWHPQFSRKTNKRFDFTTTYDTSGWLVFVSFLGEIEDTKKHFEIIWPLECKLKLKYNHRNSITSSTATKKG